MAKKAEVTRLKCAKGTYFVHLRMRRGKKKCTAAVLRLRNADVQMEHRFPVSVRESGIWLEVDFSFRPADHYFRATHWDLLIETERDGEVGYTKCAYSRKVKLQLALRNTEVVLEDGMTLFPYSTKGGKVAFILREHTEHDCQKTRFKELAALAAYSALKPYWRSRKIWVVYEKYCYRAQENGYYFFSYCMEHAPRDRRKQVFYVIDEHSPDLPRVEGHGRNVVSFMSIRHMIYTLAADYYISPDSSDHLYQWRSKPSVVKSRMKGHKLFFLQHGVMGLKRTDTYFAKNGPCDITFFLTSAQREKRIIVEDMGYSPEEVPVLGLARWDVLEDKSDSGRPRVLFMPTWRPWLENMRQGEFESSYYYRACLDLVEDASLHALLERCGVDLLFCTHPKFAEYMRSFASPTPRVQLASIDERPLNELLMECSALVTDYSSVCWDMFYQEKPVVFYQFDQDKFLDITGSYIDLNGDLPGEVCFDAASVVEALQRVVDGGYRMSDEHAAKLESWELLRDHSNCERIYRFVETAEAPQGKKKKRTPLPTRLARKLPKKLMPRFAKKATARAHYVEVLGAEDVNPRAILLESRHGEAFEGNMFYIARHLLTDPRYAEYELYLPVKRGRENFVKDQIANLPGSQNVHLVTYEATGYFTALATCKFVMNDTSFGHSFYKRPDQVYLNTWHGTPLKHLGRYVPKEAVTMGNIERNLACADYLLFPNVHTAEAMFDSYMLEGRTSGTAFLCGYPRNVALLEEDLRASVRKRMGLEGRKVYAFMPTYRGKNGDLADEHVLLTRQQLEEFDALLADDEVMFVNLHPFMAGKADCTGLSHVRMFPETDPPYDVLAACDALVTDYSSVMFDFLCTGRPIVLFVHDLERYLSERGTYLDIGDLGFPLARTCSDVLESIRSQELGSLARLQERFCAYDDVDAIERMLDFVVRGNRSSCPVFEPTATGASERVLVFVDGIRPEAVQESVERWFDDPGLTRAHYYITFRRDNDGGDRVVGLLGAHTGYYPVAASTAMSADERAAVEAFRAGNLKNVAAFREKVSFFVQREWQRRFGGEPFDKVVVLGTYNRMGTLLACECCDDVTVVLPRTYCGGVPALGPTDRERELYAAARLLDAPEWLEAELVARNSGSAVRCMQVLPKLSRKSSGGFAYEATVRLKVSEPVLAQDVAVRIGEQVLPARLSGGSGGGLIAPGVHWRRLSFSADAAWRPPRPEEDDAVPVELVFEHEGNVCACCTVFYDMVRKKYRAASLEPFVAGGTRATFAQGTDGNLVLRVEDVEDA